MRSGIVNGNWNQGNGSIALELQPGCGIIKHLRKQKFPNILTPYSMEADIWYPGNNAKLGIAYGLTFAQWAEGCIDGWPILRAWDYSKEELKAQDCSIIYQTCSGEVDIIWLYESFLTNTHITCFNPFQYNSQWHWRNSSSLYAPCL